MIEYLKQRFNNKHSWERKIVIILTAIVVIVTFVITLSKINIQSKPLEYANDLKEKIYEAGRNHELLLTHDGIIKIQKGIIHYEIGNEGYHAEATFDSDFNVKDLVIHDKATSVPMAILVSVIFAIILSIVVFFIWVFFISFISIVSLEIKHK